jgi:Ca-activated chloride channel family protein
MPSLVVPSIDYTLKDPLWLLLLLLVPLVLWLRNRRSVPVLMVPFAAAWHRPSLVNPSRWPAGGGPRL